MKLEELNKKKFNPEIPEDYFENHSDSVIKKIKGLEKGKIKLLFYWISTAATLALVVGLFYLFQPNFKNIPQQDVDAITNKNELYFNYLSDFIDEFEIEELFIRQNNISDEDIYLMEDLDIETYLEIY